MCWRRPRLYGAGWLLGLFLFLPASTILAQRVPNTLEPFAVAASFREGVQAFEAGLYGQGEVRLAEVLKATPAFFDPNLGSAAYWLGKTYLAAGRPDSAVAVWQIGWNRLTRSGAVDLMLADDFVRTVFARQDSARFEAAATMYLTLLPHLEGNLSARVDSLRVRHIVPLALILPEELREDLALDDAPTSGTTYLAEGTAARLLTWWRRMDPLPATQQNERVIEHLSRVAYASRHYADRTTPTGLDDRGLVYIRLGPPSRRKEIRFQETKHYGRIVPVPNFLETEFWVYPHVHDAAQYLFVRPLPLQGYRLGLPEDLIPSSLRASSFGLTKRSLDKADAMLGVMEQLYRDLALYHATGHYGFYYDRIAGYTADLAMSRFSERSRPPAERPGLFIQSTLGQVRMEDERAARQRDAEVPASYTNQLDDFDALPIHLRWARFLEEDGTTRTELYWSLRSRDLYPSRRVRRRLRKQHYEPSSDYLLTFHVAQQTEDYRTRARYRKPFLIYMPRDSMAAETILKPQVIAVQGDTGRFALAVQWDAYWASRDDLDGTLHQEPKLKTGTFRIDSLHALGNDPGRLEMSDIKPLFVTDTTARIEAAPPYPGAAVLPETPLAIYFEVYHLAPAAGGRTDYTVAYEVTYGRRDDEVGTAATTRYRSDQPTAREIVHLDLKRERMGPFRITVRVTDETTGQKVERALAFELYPEPRAW